ESENLMPDDTAAATEAPPEMPLGQQVLTNVSEHLNSLKVYLEDKLPLIEHNKVNGKLAKYLEKLSKDIEDAEGLLGEHYGSEGTTKVEGNAEEEEAGAEEEEGTGEGEGETEAEGEAASDVDELEPSAGESDAEEEKMADEYEQHKALQSLYQRLVKRDKLLKS